MLLQEVVPAPDAVRTEGQKWKENLSSAEEITPPPPARTYQPLVPYPQRLAWSKPSQLEPRFARFLETLC